MGAYDLGLRMLSVVRVSDFMGSGFGIVGPALRTLVLDSGLGYKGP